MADMETAPSSVQEHLGGRLKYGEIMPEKKRSVNQSFVSRGEFFQQYKSPQWQKRRLERLEASGWVCEACDADEQQLHVHHKRYVAGRKVWEYADNELSVLCESCHALHHEKADRLKKLLAQLDSAQIDMALGYMGAMVGTSLYFESCDATADVSIRVESAEEAEGVADRLHVKEQSVIDLAMSGPVRMRDLWAMRKEKKQ